MKKPTEWERIFASRTSARWKIAKQNRTKCQEERILKLGMISEQRVMKRKKIINRKYLNEWMNK